MPSIVTIYLPNTEALAEDGLHAPFVVQATEPMRSGVYEGEPDVLEQIEPGERAVKFFAEWIEGQWKFGKRVLDS